MTAVDRLAASRERLRAAMQPPPAKTHAVGPGAGLGEFAMTLIDRLKSVPGLGALIEPLETWWAQHPLRAAGVVAAEASRKLATPIAEHHPLALLFGAITAGALLTLSRPWRWLASPALLAGLLPSLAARTVRGLPMDSWLKVLGAITVPRGGRSASGKNPAGPSPR